MIFFVLLIKHSVAKRLLKARVHARSSLVIIGISSDQKNVPNASNKVANVHWIIRGHGHLLMRIGSTQSKKKIESTLATCLLAN